MIDPRIMPQVQGATSYPHKWANILTAPLSEGAISTYLEALNPCITDKFVPSPMIIQSLLYFTLHPPEISSLTPTPLPILYKIASLHSISSLMNHNTIPVYSREKIDIPNWINYEVNGDIARNIKKRMRGCEREGIWDLIWEHPTKLEDREERKGRKRRRRARDEESDEDDDEEKGGKTRVSERGWVILEWLVHIWEKDQEERGYYSPAFLAQLPKSGEMQIDNPTSPLQVLYSILNTNEDNTDGSGESEDRDRGKQKGIGKEEQNRRERTAGRLMALLFNTANPLLLTPKPPFHPSTLPLSLLPLFRLPPPKLQHLLRILSITSTRGKCNLTHFLVHGIEDAAGVRSERIGNRPPTDFIIDNTTYFPRPTIGYMFELLLLTPHDQGDGDEGEDEDEEERGKKMGILKLVLVATMLQIAGFGKEWEKGRSKSWKKAFKRCMEGNRSRRAILSLLETSKGD